MSEREQSRGKQDAPGAVVTAYAFKYSESFYDFADEKFPELKGYPPDNGRGMLLQAAIIVSTLIQMERRTRGAGRAALHDSVARAIPTSVHRRYYTAIQELACGLLAVRRGDLKTDDIPSFASVADAPDAKLTNAIGTWLVTAMSRKAQLDPPDEKLAAAIGRSAWTSATMIARMLQPKDKRTT